MVYSNTKKGASISSIVNQNHGGGDKKAGFPYQIGRGSWSNIAIKTCNPRDVEFRCCTLAKYNTTKMPLANFSRNINSVGSGPNSYWHIPGTN